MIPALIGDLMGRKRLMLLNLFLCGIGLAITVFSVDLIMAGIGLCIAFGSLHNAYNFSLYFVTETFSE